MKIKEAGLELLNQEHWKEAAELLLRYLQINKECAWDKTVSKAIVRAYSRQGKYDLAKFYFERADTIIGVFDADLKREIEGALMIHEAEQNRLRFEKMAKLTEAGIELYQKRFWNEAAAVFVSALEIEKSLPEKAPACDEVRVFAARANMHKWCARTQCQQGVYDPAIEHFKIAAELNPFDFEIFKELYDALTACKSAVEEFEKGLSLCREARDLILLDRARNRMAGDAEFSKLIELFSNQIPEEREELKKKRRKEQLDVQRKPLRPTSDAELKRVGIEFFNGKRWTKALETFERLSESEPEKCKWIACAKNKVLRRSVKVACM